MSKTLLKKALKPLALIVGVVLVVSLFSHTNNPKLSSVMVTLRNGMSGGTGIIMNSSNKGSVVLTNDHVCNLIKNGGVVKSEYGTDQIVSYKQSEISDLCLLTVNNNLHQRTDVSKVAPKMYDQVSISGHPYLMPNIISKGHLSGKSIISVMTRVRPCTEEELNSDLAIVCALLGGMPVIRSYESQLVSATIMPGSSGSGVYDKNNNLIGVVFAGQGDFGYGWIMAYNDLVRFLTVEAPNLEFTKIDQTLSLADQLQRSKYRSFKYLCLTTKDQKIVNICNSVQHDVIYRGN